MTATTQRDRLLSITTPLGEDHLLLSKMKAEEKISHLFAVEVELLHEEDESGFTATDVDVTAILGQFVTISMKHRDGTERTLNGLVNSFSKGHRSTRFSHYLATIVPHVWLLTQNFQSRIFQHKSVPSILEEVLEGFQVSFEIQGDFEPRDYCVQYRESDFDFISRLMEEEGFYYYFEHSGDGHKMIIADTPQSHRDLPSKSTIPFFVQTSREEDFVSTVRDIWVDCRLQTGTVTTWDNNFQLPGNKLDSQQPSLFKVGDNLNLERYDFPGGYGRKYDGIDGMGGEDPGHLQKVFPDKSRTAENMMNALDSGYRVITGQGDCCSMTAGHRFTIEDHPTNELNAQYVLTSVTHIAEQNPQYVSDDILDHPYTNTFTCIPHGSGAPKFCPPRNTEKPLIHSSQTATVVGPAGEEIFTDKYGRVKVQFHWDRDGEVDANSSCWIRVSQGWAGNRWGMMFIPRVGMEVLVHFIDGDPDQPIITGCVYNPQTMPPYELPDEKTKMTIKSDSSKGGKGFNELRFEDKKGDEQIFIHGQRDLDMRIRSNRRELVGNDRHLVVGNDKREHIKGDVHKLVDACNYEEYGGDHHRIIDGCKSQEVGGHFSHTIGGHAVVETGGHSYIETGGNHAIKAGGTLVLEAGAGLTLKVGGNFITITPAGIMIQGTIVLINSGGAALPSIPVQTITCEDPKKAHIADNADPGDKTTVYKQKRKKKKKHKPKSTENKDKKSWIKIKLVDEQNNPVEGERYRVTLPDGETVSEGRTDVDGCAEVKHIDPGSCKVTFPNLDKEAWKSK